MTRLGDLLEFEHVLKPLATINFAKCSTFLGNFCIGVSKSIIFLVKSFLGNFYRHLAIFSGHPAKDTSHSHVKCFLDDDDDSVYNQYREQKSIYFWPKLVSSNVDI